MGKKDPLLERKPRTLNNFNKEGEQISLLSSVGGVSADIVLLSKWYCGTGRPCTVQELNVAAGHSGF